MWYNVHVCILTVTFHETSLSMLAIDNSMLILAHGLFHTQFQGLPDFLMLCKSQLESQAKNSFMGGHRLSSANAAHHSGTVDHGVCRMPNTGRRRRTPKAGWRRGTPDTGRPVSARPGGVGEHWNRRRQTAGTSTQHGEQIAPLHLKQRGRPLVGEIPSKEGAKPCS